LITGLLTKQKGRKSLLSELYIEKKYTRTYIGEYDENYILSEACKLHTFSCQK
jgi:hypothetical protein